MQQRDGKRGKSSEPMRSSPEEINGRCED